MCVWYPPYGTAFLKSSAIFDPQQQLISSSMSVRYLKAVHTGAWILLILILSHFVVDGEKYQLHFSDTDEILEDPELDVQLRSKRQSQLGAQGLWKDLNLPPFWDQYKSGPYGVVIRGWQYGKCGKLGYPCPLGTHDDLRACFSIRSMAQLRYQCHEFSHIPSVSTIPWAHIFQLYCRCKSTGHPGAPSYGSPYAISGQREPTNR